MEKNKFNLIIAGMSVVLIVISVYVLINSPLEMKTLDLSFVVGEHLGFDLNASSLSFGIIMPGGSAVRRVVMQNNYDFPIKVEIYTSKNIRGYVFAEPEHLIESGKTEQISFNLIVPEYMEHGEYSGEVYFKFRKASSAI